jgi:hypothetical protein
VEYAAPAIPPGREAVVMLRFDVTVRLNACVAVPLAASVTLAVNANVPALVGVPEIVPLELRDTPGGSEPEARENV